MIFKSRNVFTGLLIPALFFQIAGYSQSRSVKQQPKPVRQLFGLSLRPKTIELINIVEKEYRKPIREDLKTDWPDSMGGESEVVDRGTPVIRLNVKRQHKEEIIAHELWHLTLSAKGYPLRAWSLKAGIST